MSSDFLETLFNHQNNTGDGSPESGLANLTVATSNVDAYSSLTSPFNTTFLYTTEFGKTIEVSLALIFKFIESNLMQTKTGEEPGKIPYRDLHLCMDKILQDNNLDTIQEAALTLFKKINDELRSLSSEV